MNCGCTVAAGKLSKRSEVKKMIADLVKTDPDIKRIIPVIPEY